MRLLPAAAALALVVGFGTAAPEAVAAGAPGLAATAQPVVDGRVAEPVHYRRHRGYRYSYGPSYYGFYGPGISFSYGYPYTYRRYAYRPSYYSSYSYYQPHYGYRSYYAPRRSHYRHHHRRW